MTPDRISARTRAIFDGKSLTSFLNDPDVNEKTMRLDDRTRPRTQKEGGPEGPPPDSSPREYLEPNRFAHFAASRPLSQ